MPLTSREAMFLAIEEARKGAGHVSPNPLVGCVILDGKRELLAKGYHAKVGEAHAEINALKSLRSLDLLNGAHLYVTLEPCAHEGRTPSCAKTLAKHPLASVTYGLLDPNPKVSGQGAEILRAAGIQVNEFSELGEELEDLAEVFLFNMREARPFVGLKAGSSLDGFIAKTNRESQWITGEESRLQVQWLRGVYDSVLVGAGTVLADRPALQSRHPEFAGKTNKVLILDPKGHLGENLLEGPLLKVRPPEQVIVFAPALQKEAFQSLRVSHIPLSQVGENVDLDAVLKQAYGLGISSILVEGGSYVFSQFLSQKRFQRLHAFIAPKILGGKQSVGWTKDLNLAHLADSYDLRRIHWQTLGQDAYLSARFFP